MFESIQLADHTFTTYVRGQLFQYNFHKVILKHAKDPLITKMQVNGFVNSEKEDLLRPRMRREHRHE